MAKKTLEARGRCTHVSGIVAEGMVSIGSSTDEAAFCFEKTDMYQVVTDDGKKFVLPVIGTALELL